MHVDFVEGKKAAVKGVNHPDGRKDDHCSSESKHDATDEGAIHTAC